MQLIFAIIFFGRARSRPARHFALPGNEAPGPARPQHAGQPPCARGHAISHAMNTTDNTTPAGTPAVPAPAAGPETAVPLGRIRQAREDAALVRRALRRHAQRLGETAIDLVCQRFFEEAARPDTGLKDLAAIMAVVLRAQKQALEARKLELREQRENEKRRPAAARRARQGLTEEELAEIESLAAIL